MAIVRNQPRTVATVPKSLGGFDISQGFDPRMFLRSDFDPSGAGAAAGTAEIDATRTPGSGGPVVDRKQKNLDAYTQVLQRMLNQGAYAKPYDELETELKGLYGQGNTDLQSQYNTATGQLGNMYTQAQTQIGSSMDQLKTFLQGQTNPYQGFVAQQAQATPALNELLASQGVSNDPVSQLATALNAGNAGQATAFQNVANTMGQMWGANQAGGIADVAERRNMANTALENARLGYGTQLSNQLSTDKNALNKQLLGERSDIMGKSTDARDAMMTQLLTALAGGGNLGKGGLAGLAPAKKAPTKKPAAKKPAAKKPAAKTPAKGKK
jgi:hypothetical protein